MGITDITRMLALHMATTVLAGSQMAFLSALAPGMAGVGADGVVGGLVGVGAAAGAGVVRGASLVEASLGVASPDVALPAAVSPAAVSPVDVDSLAVALTAEAASTAEAVAFTVAEVGFMAGAVDTDNRRVRTV